LIGDANQLPPVGPGRMFGDLVDSNMVPVARLTTLHRSAQESWIHVNAQRVLRGEPLDLAQRKDFRFIDVGDDASKVLPAVLKLQVETIPKEIEAPSQTLIPQRPGAAGIDACNALLQQTLNPKKPGTPFMPRGKAGELRIGDRVIQTRNDYQLADKQGVFNGELGTIVDINKGGALVDIIDRGQVAYSLEQANALQLAYALTVHRYQGSEVPWAVVVVHSTHSYILTRQLLYTAITRGKQGVILVGNKRGIDVALSDKKPLPRNTGLIERMRGEADFTEARS
jgi:exodeoxyribonuclease V alpha subunit